MWGVASKAYIYLFDDFGEKCTHLMDTLIKTTHKGYLIMIFFYYRRIHTKKTLLPRIGDSHFAYSFVYSDFALT